MKTGKKALGIIAGTAAVGLAGAIYTTKRRKYSTVKINKSIVIDRSPAELYSFLRNIENLSEIIDIVDSIQVQDEKRSRWILRGPRGFRLHCDVEISIEGENEIIGWHSIEGSNLEFASNIQFERAPGGRGTMVRVVLEYKPPMGYIGGPISGPYLVELLRRFKQRMETGEVARA